MIFVLISMIGMQIGNPLLNFGLDTSATYFYLWSHGVISDQTYEGIKSLCDFSFGYPNRGQDSTNNVHDKNGSKLSAAIELECSRFIEKSKQEIGSINPFDVTLDICKPAMIKQQLKLQKLVTFLPNFQMYIYLILLHFSTLYYSFSLGSIFLQALRNTLA